MPVIVIAARVVSPQVVEVAPFVPEFDDGVDVAAAVDRTGPSPAWKPQNGFHKRPHRSRYAIAAKISCAVAESVGVVSCCIDSALK